MLQDTLSFSIRVVSNDCPAYLSLVPRLWSDTIEAHRREVRDAIMDTTARLAAEHGVLHVTMSQVATATGIGRATLYKYFASVEEILLAWHDQQVGQHLALLADIAAREASPVQRLGSVLEAYARIRSERRRHGSGTHTNDLAMFLHDDELLAPAQQQLHDLIGGLLDEAATCGEVRSDVPPDELARFCLHALGAANHRLSNRAIKRLVGLVIDGLQPQH